MTTCHYCRAEARYCLKIYRRRSWLRRAFNLPVRTREINVCPFHRYDTGGLK